MKQDCRKSIPTASQDILALYVITDKAQHLVVIAVGLICQIKTVGSEFIGSIRATKDVWIRYLSQLFHYGQVFRYCLSVSETSGITVISSANISTFSNPAFGRTR